MDGRRRVKLSGGERQRVAIARALINEPTLILADEPTANLDAKIGREIMRLLRRVAKEQGRSVVIVSHDQRILDIADRVLWLEDGAFKDMVTMATDPVCRMPVERNQVLRWEHGGETLLLLLERMSPGVPRSEGRSCAWARRPGRSVINRLGGQRPDARESEWKIRP